MNYKGYTVSAKRRPACNNQHRWLATAKRMASKFPVIVTPIHDYPGNARGEALRAAMRLVDEKEGNKCPG